VITCDIRITEMAMPENVMVQTLPWKVDTQPASKLVTSKGPKS
jgi:hypothetical protein